MEHSTTNDRVSKSIDDLLAMQLDGCIAGSCLLGDDFSTWESEPDVDFFAYSEISWVYAVTSVLAQPRYIPGTKKDAWKLDRISQGRSNARGKFITQTIYLKDTETDIYINISYKPGASNVLDVLSRFDMVSIMIGICCRTQVKVDLRGAFMQPKTPTPIDHAGDANPIRLWYMAEGWDEETWSRELSRIKKYSDRGYNMENMAISMIKVAAKVLDKGEVIGSDKSKARYLNLMLSCYRSVVWLEEFVDRGRDEKGHNNSSQAIFDEIIKLIKDLPIEVMEKIISDLATPLLPTGDKQFEEDKEEELDETPDDR